MTTFNTNYTGDLQSRTFVATTAIRSPTCYADMFVDADAELVESLVEGAPSSDPVSLQQHISPTKTDTALPLNRLETLKIRAQENFSIQNIPDTHYTVIDTVADALNAAVTLAEYHSISVLWEGFNVNRYGTLTWIICGYLGSAVLFDLTRCGAKIFTEGGLKTLLESRHPIKVIHDCTCIADILFHQYGVRLSADSIFDTHAADLLIQTKTGQPVVSKSLTDCLIEYQDLPITVYRQRDSIMKRDPSVWVMPEIPPQLLLTTARMARYAALLYGQMLCELSKPLPQITDIYLNYRHSEASPDPKARSRIPSEIEELLVRASNPPLLRTEWKIPDTVLNPVYDPQPGDEHFYSKPFKIDPKKTTPGSLKIFSVDTNKSLVSHDNDWEKYVETAPKYPLPEQEEEEEEEYEEEEEMHDILKSPAPQLQTFKVPSIFSNVSSSSSILQGMTSREKVTSSDHVTSSDLTSSSSDDGVRVIVPECTLPPTIKAARDPSFVGSRIVWPGDPGDTGQGMCPELREMVHKIREEKKNQMFPSDQAYSSSREMGHSRDEEDGAFSEVRRQEGQKAHRQEARSEEARSEEARSEEGQKEIVAILPRRAHRDTISNSSNSEAVVIVEHLTPPGGKQPGGKQPGGKQPGDSRCSAMSYPGGEGAKTRSATSSNSTDQRPPLIIIPKSRPGRGARIAPGLQQPPQGARRGRGRAAAISNKTVARDFLTSEERSSASSTGSIHHVQVGGDSSRTDIHNDHVQIKEDSSGDSIPYNHVQVGGDYSGTSIHNDHIQIKEDSESDGGFDQDFYDFPVTLSSDSIEPKQRSPGLHRSPGLQQREGNFAAAISPSMKTPVSLCLVYDSDDPDNW